LAFFPVIDDFSKQATGAQGQEKAQNLEEA